MNQSLSTTFISIIFFLNACNGKIAEENKNLVENELKSTLQSIYNVLDFMRSYHNQLNLDAFFGVTLAQAQIEQALENVPLKYGVVLYDIRRICQDLLDAYVANPSTLNARNDVLFKNILLRTKLWYNPVNFKMGLLADLGLHSNWTSDDLTRNKTSDFHGLNSDQCLGELLESDCKIERECGVMMLEDRNDTLYLLTHRLLFMQLARGIHCGKLVHINYYAKKFCTLIWKDAKTIEYLGFSNLDVFLEQMLLCGMEGYEEFLISRWRNKPIIWQTEQGCYEDSPTTQHEIYKRTANVIEFGCVDHTTGLGLATLSLNVRYLIYTMRNP